VRPEDDLDHRAIAAAAIAVGPLAVTATPGAALSDAWADRFRRQFPTCYLREIAFSGSTILLVLASAVAALQDDRTLAAWGRSRRPAAPRDRAYQRGHPSPRGRAPGRWTGAT
jgi:hypothetical protein